MKKCRNFWIIHLLIIFCTAQLPVRAAVHFTQLSHDISLQIVIRQPWWNTFEAWIGYALLFIVTVYYLFRYYSARRKKIEAKEKIDFFINTANDLLTPLELEVTTGPTPLDDMALTNFKKSNLAIVNNNRDKDFVDNLTQFVEKNLTNPDLNVTLLCKEMALSRTLLYNRITRLTGSSPNEFIRNIRLKKAADLLISGKYAVAEVSTMVGIGNSKYFSRIFKSYFHVSPKNYLK